MLAGERGGWVGGGGRGRFVWRGWGGAQGGLEGCWVVDGLGWRGVGWREGGLRVLAGGARVGGVGWLERGWAVGWQGAWRGWGVGWRGLG